MPRCPALYLSPNDTRGTLFRFDQRRRELVAAVWRGEVVPGADFGVEGSKTRCRRSRAVFPGKAELQMRLLAMKKLPLPTKPLVGRGYDEFVSRNSAPGFASRDMVALDLINHLEGPLGDATYRKRRSLWFAPVWRLLRSQENTPAIDEMLAQSSNPILMLYGQLAKLQATVGRTHSKGRDGEPPVARRRGRGRSSAGGGRDGGVSGARLPRHLRRWRPRRIFLALPCRRGPGQT